MRCDEFDERVHSLLDNRVPIHSDQRLLEHADACSKCRGMLGTYDDLFVGLECGETLELSSDFTQRVVAQVCAGQPQTVRPTRNARRWFALAAVAIAAGLLIALIPFLRSRPSPNEPTPQVVEEQSNEQTEPPARESTDGESSHDDAPQLAEGAADGKAAEDPGDQPLPWFPDTLAPSDLPHRFVPVDEIRGGLRPITSSLAVAIDALRSTIPIGRSDPPKEPTDHSPSASFVPHGRTPA
jgi:hypothetical protein